MLTTMEQAFDRVGVVPTKRNTVFIAGIESIYKNEVFQKYGWVFMNNAQSYVRMNPKEKVKIVDCRNYANLANPIERVLEEVRKIRPLHKLVIGCHSDPTCLYIFSRTRYDLPDDHKFLDALSGWQSLGLVIGGDVELQGCQTAGYHGEPLDECIAQAVADQTLCDVHGFINKSSQKKIGNEYVQQAQGGYRLVKPRGV